MNRYEQKYAWRIKLLKGISFLSGILLFTVFSIAASTYYQSVGKEVRQFVLQYRENHNLIPLVYSTPVQFSKGMNLSPEFIEDELVRRGYSQSPAIPEVPGTFARTSSSIEVVSRYKPAQLITLYFNSEDQFEIQQIAEITGNQEHTLYLEPELLGEESVDSTASYRPLAAFPVSLIQAVLATEDHRFYEHCGIDLLSMVRAAISDISAGSIVDEGLTITQKVAKNTISTDQGNYLPKIKEIFAAIYLDKLLSKEQILELYLNQVFVHQSTKRQTFSDPMGSITHVLFGKDLHQLNLAESALLASSVQIHSEPSSQGERSIQRRNQILQRMYDEGYIDEFSFTLAALEPVPINPYDNDFQEEHSDYDFTRKESNDIVSEFIPNKRELVSPAI